MFTTGLLPANDDPLADALFFFISLVAIPVNLTGMVFNVVNIIVFARDKSSDSINVTLLAIAVADLGCLFTNLIHSAFINPLFIMHKTLMEPMEVVYLVASVPRVCFSRTSVWLILFVAFERCLCVVKPLKVKVIVTKTRTISFVIFSFVFSFILSFPVYVSTRLDLKWSKPRNKTLVGFVLTSDFGHIHDGISLFCSVNTFASFVLLIILTAVLVLGLNQKTKWRTEYSTSGNDLSFKNRDWKLVKMILIIDIILIVCYFPSVVLNILNFAITEFTFGGRLESLFLACWNIAFLLESINSSINIFVYYTMSSKFKDGMQKLFPFLVKTKPGHAL